MCTTSCNPILAARIAAARGMMDQTCEVLSATPTLDQFGSVTMTEAVAGRHPCRLVRPSTRPHDRQVAAQSVADADWVILLPLTARVVPEDRVRVGGATGRAYHVIDTDAGAASAAYLTVYARSER